MANKMDGYIDALFQVLPAPSYEEIRLKLQRELGVRFTIGHVATIIAHLRKHVDEYGWTIPHVGHGHQPDKNEQCYFAVLVEKDGSFTMDKDHQEYISNGSNSVMKSIGTQASNMAIMIDITSQYERSKSRKDHLGDMYEQVVFLAKRAKRMAQAFTAEVVRLKAV